MASDKVASDVNAAIDAISSTLPSAVDPRVVTGSLDDMPVAILALSSDAEAAVVSEQVTTSSSRRCAPCPACAT